LYPNKTSFFFPIACQNQKIKQGKVSTLQKKESKERSQNKKQNKKDDCSSKRESIEAVQTATFVCLPPKTFQKIKNIVLE
jgi:hypothetical protein